MAKRLSSDVRKTLKEGITEIGQAIQELETKNLIEGLVQSYSKLDRKALEGKSTYLIQSLRMLCGSKGAELIINILNRGSSEGAFQLIGEVENNDVKQFLQVLVMKYGAQYQWLLDPFPNDWQRYNFTTKYLGAPSLPLICTSIVDKSGRMLELESPLTSFIDLVVAQIKHLKKIDEEMEDLGQPRSVQKIVPRNKLENIKEIVERLLETPTKKK